jgi:hypothetical protein
VLAGKQPSSMQLSTSLTSMTGHLSPMQSPPVQKTSVQQYLIPIQQKMRSGGAVRSAAGSCGIQFCAALRVTGFEREALEEWLAANPGVHPLSRQPLLLSKHYLLPNHALRNMIQQLYEYRSMYQRACTSRHATIGCVRDATSGLV